MKSPLNDHAINQIFLEARTFNTFKNQEISDELIKQLYNLMKWGPTSMNCQPSHYLVIKSPTAKERLRPSLNGANLEKTLIAPATIVISTDTQFYESMSVHFPAYPEATDMYKSNSEQAQSTALTNTTLQAAYMILAARTLGLDCGPMAGFDNTKLDAEFFADGRYKSCLLINIGYGDPSGNYPRGPRKSFSESVKIL